MRIVSTSTRAARAPANRRLERRERQVFAAASAAPAAASTVAPRVRRARRVASALLPATRDAGDDAILDTHDPTPFPGHRRAAVRRRGGARRTGRAGAARAHLRLVVSAPRVRTHFGMHPALPATLAFAALSMTALAFAAVVDVANAVARTALAVNGHLRAARAR
jgi:hypothetical protein